MGRGRRRASLAAPSHAQRAGKEESKAHKKESKVQKRKTIMKKGTNFMKVSEVWRNSDFEDLGKSWNVLVLFDFM